MRLSSQNNTFILNLPNDFIPPYLQEDFDKLMDKNFVPYDTVTDYLSSSIREVVFPGASFETSNQIAKRGKRISWKEAGNIFDKFGSELDITFRSIDSWLNYYMLLQVLVNFYLDNQKHQLPLIILQILDKNGDLIYTVVFREVIFKSISEVRMNYNAQEINDQTFAITFTYNWIDVYWELDDENTKTSTSIFDIPIVWKSGSLDRKVGNVPYDYFNRGPKPSKY